MSNTYALLEMYRSRGVMAATNQHGQVVFYGVGVLTRAQREVLFGLPQHELKAAMKRQGRV